MTLLSKRYCSHCGTPNSREVQTCGKCKKPLNSALKAVLQDDDFEEALPIKRKRPTSKARIVYEDDGESFDGDIVQPSLSDVIVEKPKKFTVGALRDGAPIPTVGGGEQLPSDVEVSSRAYFHQEKLD